MDNSIYKMGTIKNQDKVQRKPWEIEIILYFLFEKKA